MTHPSEWDALRAEDEQDRRDGTGPYAVPFKRIQIEVVVNLTPDADERALTDELCDGIEDIVAEFVSDHEDVINDDEGWSVA